MKEPKVIYEVSQKLLTEICEITCDEWYAIHKFADTLYSGIYRIDLIEESDGLHIVER